MGGYNIVAKQPEDENYEDRVVSKCSDLDEVELSLAEKELQYYKLSGDHVKLRLKSGEHHDGRLSLQAETGDLAHFDADYYSGIDGPDANRFCH